MKQFDIEIKYERNRARIYCEDSDLLNKIRDEFTILNPAVKYFKYASPTISAITPLGTYLIGLTPDILQVINKIDKTIKINISEEITNIINPKWDIEPEFKYPLNEKYKFRNYQETAIKNILSRVRGINIIPTRGGKNLIMYGVLSNIKDIYEKNILIFVPNTQLVLQGYQDFIDYGWDKNFIQMFSSQSKTLDENKTGIIISNRQWLEKHNQELPNVDILLVDEVHNLTANNQCSKYIKNLPTNFKLGFTGSLSENMEDIWNVKGIIGPIINQVEIIELQEANYLANINIIPIQFKHLNKRIIHYSTLEEYKQAFIDEYNIIEENEISNKYIFEIAKKLKGNTLILFSHIEHGRKLFEMLEHENKCFVDGSVPFDDRELTKQKMSQKSNCITLANYGCFSTGITLKELDNIILASSTKSVIRLLQSIGRGLFRSKEKLNLIDISHNYKYSEKHLNQRLKYYDKFYGKKDLKINVINI